MSSFIQPVRVWYDEFSYSCQCQSWIRRDSGQVGHSPDFHPGGSGSTPGLGNQQKKSNKTTWCALKLTKICRKAYFKNVKRKNKNLEPRLILTGHFDEESPNRGWHTLPWHEVWQFDAATDHQVIQVDILPSGHTLKPNFLYTFRIKTEQANEIARLIRQYITIDQKSRDVGASQVSLVLSSTFYLFIATFIFRKYLTRTMRKWIKQLIQLLKHCVHCFNLFYLLGWHIFNYFFCLFAILLK